MIFARDYSCGRREDGEEIQFTSAEARLLEHMARHPGQTLTRDQLLDATSGQGSDRGARSIDFMINRLRRKLGDDAREPRFIATRYGGGYLWVSRQPQELDGSYLVVGPLRGFVNIGSAASQAEGFALAAGRAGLWTRPSK